MLSKEEKLLYSLSALKEVIETWDIDVEVTLTKDGNKHTINAYEEIEKFIVNYINGLQPYKFEDLKKTIGKPIYDKKYKEFYILAEVKEEELYKDEGIEKFMICSDKKGLIRVWFEENRFYPVQMANVRCE